MKISKTTERWSPLIVLAGILLLWQAFVSALAIPDYIFPGPWQIAGEFMEFKGPLLEAACEFAIPFTRRGGEEAGMSLLMSFSML